MATASDYMIVAAIDFGTTYSGYAFQLTEDYDSKDPTRKILSPQAWNSGTVKLVSLKTPTCLLLNTHQEIHSFGYMAEEKYADLCMDGVNEQWYFFRRFKMALHERSDLSKNTKLRDETGKEMTAIRVFGLSIQCLKNSLNDLLAEKKTPVKPENILWVLTVPAIWQEAAKQFMREAAILAGIKYKQCRISLEPEAASIFCQYLPVERFSVGGTEKFSESKAGTTYMIVDLGGGTADMTVHEKLASGKLKETHRASGGPWGGTAVDSAFIKLISDIIGGPVFRVFMREKRSDYLELMRDFEIVKRTVSMICNANINMKLPVSLNETCLKVVKKNFKQLVQDARKNKLITFVGDKTVFDAELMKSLFAETTQKVIKHMKKILTTEAGKKASLILMVGGFSESTYVQEKVKAEFHDKNGRKVLIPKDAGISVVQGAVVFGRQPGNITSRIVRFTYGAEICPNFVDGVHDPKRKFTSEYGDDLCRGVFSPFLKAGEEVTIGAVAEETYITARPFQADTDLRIFVSTSSSQKYTNDASCSLLGKLTVKIPTPSKERRPLKVSYILGDTELHVKALDVKSNTGCETILNMLE